MRKHVQKLLNHQRDILSPQAIEAIQAAMASCQTAVAENADKATLEKQMENLEKAANKWLKPYPNAAWRENVEVLLVALAVAMGIRTFFLQPFKIPTGLDAAHALWRHLGEPDRRTELQDPDRLDPGTRMVRGRFLPPRGGGRRRPRGNCSAPVPHPDLQPLAEACRRRQDVHDVVPA